MLPALLVVLGAVVGFAGSRRLRRPVRTVSRPPVEPPRVERPAAPSFGRRRALSAPELQRACLAEMVRHVGVDPDGVAHAPARYVLQLHPRDLATVEETRRWFTDGLVEALRQAAADGSWHIEGPASVGYEDDPSRRPGAPRALTVDPARPTAVVRADTGERIPLATAPVTIGRSRDRTVVIDDDRVSRSHARLEPAAYGWVVVDEGSANGTRVNASGIEAGRAQRLRVGDTIGIGPVDLRVEADGGDRTPPGGRALDDGDRTQILNAVLPPEASSR